MAAISFRMATCAACGSTCVVRAFDTTSVPAVPFAKIAVTAAASVTS